MVVSWEGLRVRVFMFELFKSTWFTNNYNMRNSLYSVTVDEALLSVGGSARYQKHLLLLVCGIWFIQSLFSANIAFLLNHPDKECENDDCCSQYSNTKNISNSNPAFSWILVCSTNSRLALLSKIYFGCLSLGIFLICYLSNYFSRKTIIIVSLAITSICEFSLTMCKSSELITIFYIFSGIFIGGSTINSYIYIHECVEGDVRHWCTCFIFISWGLGLISNEVMSRVGLDWNLYTIIISCSNILLIPPLFRFYESPRFLAANQGKYTEARKILNQIASYNSRSEFTEMLEGEKVIGYHESGSITSPASPNHSSKYSFVPISNGIVSVSESEMQDVKKFGLKDLITLKSLRTSLNISIYIWTCISLAYYTVVFSMPHNLINSSTQNLVMLSIEIITLIVVCFLLNKFGRQLSLVIHLAIASACCLLTLAFISEHYPNDTIRKVNKMFQITLLLVSRFALVSSKLASFLFITESFPTNVRSIVFGVVASVSVVAHAFFPFIFELGKIIGIHGLFFVSLLLVISSFCSCLLHDTLGKNMEDYVEEEKETMHSPKNQGIELSRRRFQAFNEEVSS